MLQQVLELHTPIILIIALTVVLIYRDRSFVAQVRCGFYMIFALALVNVGVDIAIRLNNITDALIKRHIFLTCKIVIYPVMLVLWYVVLTRAKHKKTTCGLAIACAVNTVLAIVSIWTNLYYDIVPFNYLPQCLITAILLVILIYTGRRENSESTAEVAGVHGIVALIAISAIMENVLDCHTLLNTVFIICISFHYCYLVMQIYKRDALTRLLNRHNMQYDMETLQKKQYIVSIVDIDNFKLINDKYGHQKGDEALVYISKAIMANLDGRCKLYRYGGDEFAVITSKLSVDELDSVFRKLNDELETANYRISYGTAIHEPGQNTEDVIKAADEEMYRHKRKLKSEDIWDDMTGLFNLRGFLDELQILEKQALREKKNICLVSIDIERLSNINMAYGYAEGNLVITTVAGIIRSGMDVREFAGHFGSDEFGIAFLVNPGDIQYPKSFVDRLVSRVSETQTYTQKGYSIELNSAIYEMNFDDMKDPESAVNQVLYLKNESKENRRKAGYSYDEFEERPIDQKEEALALEIINESKLRYAFQPIVSAKDGKIVAYEALMRASTEPMLSPLSILRYATKHKLSYEIEKLTFSNVLAQISSGIDLAEDALIFVNSLPGFILKNEDYNLLREKYGHMLGRLVVEITEQSQLADSELAIIEKRKLEDGYQIAIDDFGSGNSNTYSLLKYKPQYIKLDRLLVADINRNTKKQYFVNSIITFAKENGMAVLAEGVETEEELKMMIRLQVDYIQGYFTGRPEYEPVKEIPEDIQKMIINENIRGVIEGKRKYYITSGNWDVSLVQLALEEYTGVTVASEELTFIGNSDYVADLTVKIKDGLECELTLQDVKLSSVDDMPCIELGEGSHLTLNIEGNCSLNKMGIRVPESAKLTIKGHGNLEIKAKGHLCYGIGGNYEEPAGEIELAHSGMLSVSVDGDQGIAIGGGIYKQGAGINVISGQYEISVAAVDGIAIGCAQGDVPITMKDFWMNMEFRVNRGTAIGSIHGNQNIDIRNFNLSIGGSGSAFSAIGSNNPSGGKVEMNGGSFLATVTGQEIHVIGIREGELDFKCEHAKMQIKAEGNKLLGIGSWDKSSKISLNNTATEIVMNAAEVVPFGARDENICFTLPEPTVRINE